MKAFARFVCWARWKLGLRPPWVHLPKHDPWGDQQHCEHQMEAVSRHAIAETGLICPRCLKQVCFQGDYTLVREGQVGRVRNEVVICPHQREVNGEKKQCGSILMASPETEHGDHHLWDKVPPKEREALFFRFRRVSEEQVLRDRYGFDVSKYEDGALKADPALAKGQAEEDDRPELTYALEDVYVLSNGKMGRIIELLVEHDGDKHFAGWCVMEIDGVVGPRWFVDRKGTVRCDMTDPTMNNLRLVHKQQKV